MWDDVAGNICQSPCRTSEQDTPRALENHASAAAEAAFTTFLRITSASSPQSLTRNRSDTAPCPLRPSEVVLA